MKRALLTFLVLALAAPVSLVAEVEEEPGRGVARISLINGDVSVRRGDSGDWVAAVINAPLVVPDSIFVGAASRAEVQLDYANMVRLAANTEVRFSELEYRRYQLQLAKGTITFSVLRDSDADVDLSTPNVSVRPQKKGRYRVTVHEDGTTEITVRDGRAEIYTPRGVEELREGKTMMVRGPASDPEFQVLAAARPDEWDRWNERRDKELRRSRAYQYVSHDIYGAEDLDAYGEWIYVPPYGWVWSPRGLGAVSLRALVPPRSPRMVLVAGRVSHPPFLASRAGGLLRLGQLQRLPRRHRRGVWFRPHRVGAAGALRAVLPLVWAPLLPRLPQRGLH